jgi:hypothetical protein
MLLDFATKSPKGDLRIVCYFYVGKIGKNEKYKSTSWEKFFLNMARKIAWEGFFSRKFSLKLQRNLGNHPESPKKDFWTIKHA